MYDFESEPSLTGAVKPVRPLADTTNFNCYKKINHYGKKNKMKETKNQRKDKEKTLPLVPLAAVDISNDSSNSEATQADLMIIMDISGSSSQLSDVPNGTSTPLNERSGDIHDTSDGLIGEAISLLEHARSDRENRHSKCTGLYTLKYSRPLRDFCEHETGKGTEADKLLLQ